MGSTQLNNEMNLQYPDGFKIMSEEELRKHKFYEEAPGFCINDPDRHIVLSVSWRDEVASPFYDEMLLEDNSDTMNALYLYVTIAFTPNIPRPIAGNSLAVFRPHQRLHEGIRPLGGVFLVASSI